MAHVGVHCMLELYGCDKAKLDDVGFLTSALRECAEHAGATFLGELQHRFTPVGVTCLGLLAESHISIHTWPEIGYAAADCFTCGDAAMPEKACHKLAEMVGAARSSLVKIPRAAQLNKLDVEGVDPNEAHMSAEGLELHAFEHALPNEATVETA
ncbi:MAG: adenosylmethionine decarboxylase [Planctomycetota bacterium]